MPPRPLWSETLARARIGPQRGGRGRGRSLGRAGPHARGHRYRCARGVPSSQRRGHALACGCRAARRCASAALPVFGQSSRRAQRAAFHGDGRAASRGCVCSVQARGGGGAQADACRRPDAVDDPAPALGLWPGVRANFLRLLRTVARGVPLPLAAIDNRRSLLYVGNLVDAIRSLPRARGRGREDVAGQRRRGSVQLRSSCGAWRAR